MYQQINLYQPVFRQQRKVFSARTLLLMLAAATVLLLGIYAHARWTLAALNHTATSIEQQYRQMETQLGNLEIINQSADSGALDNEIERLQHSIAEQQSLLDSFDQLAIRSAAGFGDFFDTLARQTLPGLWLTGVRLTLDGETELRGTTLDPKLVPGYLQLLPDQPRFRSLQQGSLHLVRHEAENSDIEFRIRSKDPEESQQ
jgi:cell division protein FtsL